LNNDIIINRRNTSTNRMNYIKNSDPSGVTSDSNNGTYININIGTEKYIDINEIDFDKFSDTKIDTNNNSNLESDISSVTDNKYLTDNKKIRIIF
jgi:hypothetical protein